MTKQLMGRKLGMTQKFDDSGRLVPCTVLLVEPHVIAQIKTVEKDGYNGIQLASEKITAKDPRRQEARCKKPQRGHFKKADVDPRKNLMEVRLESVEEFSVGQELSVDLFSAGELVDVTGTSIGKGYQGVMKKHGFAGGPAAHGSGFHRHAGSTGMRSTPGRCLPGGKRASQMGNVRVTVEKLSVVDIDEKANLLVVKGSIPGSKNSLVTVRSAKKA